MESLSPTTKIDVERVKSALLQRKPTTSRFNLPMTYQQAKDSMKAAVIAEVERRQMKFAENEALDSQLSLMAEWLTTNDHRFCLLLCGKCGNGKSTLVKGFQNLLNLLGLRDEYGNSIGFAIVDAREIAWMCRDRHQEWRMLSRRNMLAIDDLGTEPVEVLEYGNHLNPVIDLLYKRYDEQLFTIITTNLTPKEIRERYGERIADRLNEMAFRIVFDNETYRTNHI